MAIRCFKSKARDDAEESPAHQLRKHESLRARRFLRTFKQHCMSSNQFKLVTEYPIRTYRCGLQVGERLKLKKDIIMRDHTGKPTGEVLHAGEVWIVLSGAAESPTVVWLRQPDGERHTWDDELSIFEAFERIT